MDFDSFYFRYFDLIVNYLYRRCLNYQAALDVGQETFLKAFKHFSTIQQLEEKAAKSYLFKIANSAFADFITKEKNHEPLDGDYPSAQESSDTWGTTLEAKLLVEKIKLLPIHYQEVLMLRFVEDMSYESIAQVLNKPEGTLRSLLKRGIEKLREVSLENSPQFALA